MEAQNGILESTQEGASGVPVDRGQVQAAKKTIQRSPPVAMEVRVLAIEALESGLDPRDVAEVVGVADRGDVEDPEPDLRRALPAGSHSVTFGEPNRGSADSARLLTAGTMALDAHWIRQRFSAWKARGCETTFSATKGKVFGVCSVPKRFRWGSLCLLVAALHALGLYGCCDNRCGVGDEGGFSVTDDVRAEIAIWPDNKPAALTLAFDDTRQCLHQIVAPALESRGMHGTFSLNTKAISDWSPWIAMSAAGHELANHTRNHLRLDSLSLSQARSEIENGRANLLSFVPGIEDVATFTYPDGASTQSIRDLVMETHISARGYWGWNDPSPSDYSMIKGRGYQDLTQCKHDVRRAISTHTWLVAYFHEVGPNGMPAEDFDSYLDFISGWRDSLAIATQGYIAKYTIERDRCVVLMSGKDPGRIWLATDLDPERFNVPLSVRIMIDKENIELLSVNGHPLVLDEQRSAWIEIAPGDTISIRQVPFDLS